MIRQLLEAAAAVALVALSLWLCRYIGQGGDV